MDKLEHKPLCKCHNEPMYWNKDSRLKAGGNWRCLVEKRETHRRYLATEKGQMRNRRRVRMFGERFSVPDMLFRRLAIQLRENRKRSLKEITNG